MSATKTTERPPWTLAELLEWMEDKDISWRYKSVGLRTPETKEPYVPITSTIHETVKRAISGAVEEITKGP